MAEQVTLGPPLSLQPQQPHSCFTFDRHSYQIWSEKTVSTFFGKIRGENGHKLSINPNSLTLISERLCREHRHHVNFTRLASSYCLGLPKLEPQENPGGKRNTHLFNHWINHLIHIVI